MNVLPLPKFYDRNRRKKHYFPRYDAILKEASTNRVQYKVLPSGNGKNRINLIIVDPQETFTMMIDGQAELYVANAEDHMANLAEFIYKFGHLIDSIFVTIDSHYMWQIDMPGFWVDKNGEIVTDNVQITLADLKAGNYRVNPQMEFINEYGLNYAQLQAYAMHYVSIVKTERSEDHAKWAGHSMLMGPGYTVIPILYEALIYWEALRSNRVFYHIKGLEQLAQRYSPIQNQVLQVGNLTVGYLDINFIQRLLENNTQGQVINLIGGEADSHCVNWMVRDTFKQVENLQPGAGQSLVPLSDCMGPVIIPGVIDFTFLETELFAFCKQNNVSVMQTVNAQTWMKDLI